MERIRKNLVVRLKGELDHHTSPLFRNAVEKELARGIAQNLILNLEELNFMDSSGLGVILGRYKQISEKGGKLVACRLRPQVERIYELSGLSKIIPVYRSEQEAINKL